MKEYNRLTDRDIPLSVVRNIEHATFYYRLQVIEDKIESGELRNTEEIRKETAKEILEMYSLSDTFSSFQKKVVEKYDVEVE